MIVVFLKVRIGIRIERNGIVDIKMILRNIVEVVVNMMISEMERNIRKMNIGKKLRINIIVKNIVMIGCFLVKFLIC